MDKLAFGLDRPKLAVMKDGGVFVAGKPIITAVAGTPAAGVQEKGSKSVRSVIAPQTVDGWVLQQMISGLLAPPALSLDYVTMNQGAERYLNAANSSTGKPYSDAKMAFKPKVPSIAGRAAMFKIRVSTSRPIIGQNQGNLMAEATLPWRSSKVPLQFQRLEGDPTLWTIFNRTHYLSEPLFLSEEEAQKGRTFSIDMDAKNILSLSPTSRTVTVDPKWEVKPTLDVRLIPVNYTDENGTTFPVTIPETTRQEVEAMLKVVYPVSLVTVSVLSTPIDYRAVLPGGGTPRPLTTKLGQENLVEAVRQRWIDAGKPDYIHFSGIFSGYTGQPMDTGRGYTPGISNSFTPGPYSIVWSPNLGSVNCSMLPHELGHNHGLRHAPTLASSVITGCSGLVNSAPDGSTLDQGFPYPFGELGGVLGFNAVNRWVVDTVSDRSTYHDIMGYAAPHFSSDYFFMKTSEWASNHAPAPLSFGVQEPVSQQAGLKMPGGFEVHIDGEFTGSSLKFPKISTTSRFPSKASKIAKTDWMIQLTHRNGKTMVFPVSTGEIMGRTDSTQVWDTKFPEDDWVSYRLLHQGKDVGGESFKDLSDGMETKPDQPLLSLNGDRLRWNLPKKPTHGFSIALVGENGEYIDSLTNTNYFTEEARVPKAFLNKKLGTLRVRVTAGYGLKVKQFTFNLEPNRSWNLRQLTESTQSLTK